MKSSRSKTKSSEEKSHQSIEPCGKGLKDKTEEVGNSMKKIKSLKINKFKVKKKKNL